MLPLFVLGVWSPKLSVASVLSCSVLSCPVLSKGLRYARWLAIRVRRISQSQHCTIRGQHQSCLPPSRRSLLDGLEDSELYVKQPKSAPKHIYLASQMRNKNKLYHEARRIESRQGSLTCHTRTPIPSLLISRLMPQNSFSHPKSQNLSSRCPFTIR